MLTIKGKKNVRRRSNWYIYLISFAASFALLSLFIMAFWENFFPNLPQPALNRQGNMNYVPSEELDVTVLLMMGETQGGVPDYFMLMNYRANEEIIVLVPLRAETKVSNGFRNGKLTDLYRQGGAESVISGIKGTYKIECDFYIKFDRMTFISFIGMLDDTPVNIPFDLSDGGITFKSGLSLLTSSDLYNYITFAKFNNENEDYRLVVMGSSVVSLINNNGKFLSSEKIQNLFNKILNNADTNLTFKDYTAYQQALLYTSENSVKPSTYYIPFGEYDSAGAFITSEESIADILNKFALG